MFEALCGVNLPRITMNWLPYEEGSVAKRNMMLPICFVMKLTLYHSMA